jgi:hypothetical protein
MSLQATTIDLSSYLKPIEKVLLENHIALQNKISEARQAALELCWQIERLPASTEQTKCSIMASELGTKLNNLLK